MIDVKAIIEGYMQGAGRQYTSKVIVRVVDFQGAVELLIGKKIVYKDKKGNVYVGRLIKKHGKRNPLLIARFRPNLPGQAIGSTAEIMQ